MPYSQVRGKSKAKELDLERKVHVSPGLSARSPEKVINEASQQEPGPEVVETVEGELEAARDSVRLEPAQPPRRSLREVGRPSKYSS